LTGELAGIFGGVTNLVRGGGMGLIIGRGREGEGSLDLALFVRISNMFVCPHSVA
jgi:hypothetical protein